MAKHNSKKLKKSLFYKGKSLVGLTPVLVLKFLRSNEKKIAIGSLNCYSEIPLLY